MGWILRPPSSYNYLTAQLLGVGSDCAWRLKRYVHHPIRFSHVCQRNTPRLYNLVDTSDTTYESRHQKYETFEKRQRLREEKPKHEQYKLKERIDKLRGMNVSAFLTLPTSLFCLLSALVSQEGDASAGGPIVVDDDVDTGLHDLPRIRVNGAALHNRDKRQRRQILKTAAGLEEHYRVLLPPNKVVRGVRHPRPPPSLISGSTSSIPKEARIGAPWLRTHSEPT
jgi:hypothetical protein